MDEHNATGNSSGVSSDAQTASTTVATQKSESYVYTCRMCRRVLFRQGDIMPHGAGYNNGSSGPKGFLRKGARREPAIHNENGQLPLVAENICTSYFLDPDISVWVASESREAHASNGGAGVLPDTIYCPHKGCRAKIGAQSWVGSQCSCGVWVTPAFKIYSRAVDKMTIPAGN
ncbi:hypothetical protein ERJ75_001669600 [Trypanosoma vivax]|uniref:Dual specificity protein phosphatase n=1 Tax=Trypanosoma vivax (strain Y486) TaxID=1055687 RepID=G0U8L6_TRYVY|nr:hypothetical protein TRVL_00472 [Trypanosoma vivax]KAH8604945.1 hypothetical protein ERJ75_001669600 [Trypanosoma vivax]CCC53942.1 conserved hypothetical protein [Trypanosoma vivax Y486]